MQENRARVIEAQQSEDESRVGDESKGRDGDREEDRDRDKGSSKCIEVPSIY
jgi:hypothetical protein